MPFSLPKVLRSRSLTTLILIGFAVAVLPLAATLLSAVDSVDQLADSSQKVANRVAQLARINEFLRERLVDLERQAKRHLVLEDAESRTAFEEAYRNLIAVLDSLPTPVEGPDLRGLTASVTAAAGAVYDRLAREQEPPVPLLQPGHRASKMAPAEVAAKRMEIAAKRIKEEADPLFDELSGKARQLARAVSTASAAEVRALESQSEAVQQRILTRSSRVLPISVVLILLLAFLIIRSIRQLDLAIRRLGGGDLLRPIRVVGPKDLEYLGQRLDWLRGRLLALEEAKQQFMRHVSHELKTPLATIHEGTGLLAEEVVGVLNTEQQDIARILVANTHKLETLISSLINYSQANAHPSALRRERFEASALTRAVIEDNQILLRAKSISLKPTLRPLQVYGNPEQFRTIVDNLLSNAIKYSPEGGEIRIDLRKGGGHLELEIEDEGPGVDKEERTEIFEPFFRGKAGREGTAGGSGLGLAIVSECVVAHHGIVEALDPRAGRTGARIRVQIPCRQDD